MKKTFLILSILISAVCYGQKDPCEKQFVKVKNKTKKSAIFSNENIIQTKFNRFYRNGSRQLFIGFKKTDKSYVCIQQYKSETMSFKQDFVLGNAIRIGVLFDNGKNYIIKFNSSENSAMMGTIMDANVSYNETELDSAFDELLRTAKIKLIEIQNPFGNPNKSVLRSEDVGKGDAEDIMEKYNCFLNKVNSAQASK